MKLQYLQNIFRFHFSIHKFSNINYYDRYIIIHTKLTINNTLLMKNKESKMFVIVPALTMVVSNFFPKLLKTGIP